MGYQALLFCPDEKTARTVTQVLGELEFTVEPCAEPFAAVKRLMAEHFDAIVVDCDNEQNATLLFKSARNSSSNQASLAVAVVEGQAGVAKAFRIGANLVLTKPINVEQAKGTLRVARGLLRKGEAARPAAAGAVAAPAAAPGVTAKAAPRAATPGVARPPATLSRPGTIPPPSKAAQAAVASSDAAPQDEDLFEIGLDADEAPATNPAPAAKTTNVPMGQSASAAASHASAVAGGSSRTSGGGAASAPAPARAAQEPPIGEIASAPATDLRAEGSSAETVPGTAFTFGGANAPESSGGGSKKVLLGVAAVALVAAALYYGWTQFHDKLSSPTTEPTQTVSPSAPRTQAAPVQASPAAKPANAPAGTSAVPASSGSAMPSSTAANPSSSGISSTKAPASSQPAASEDTAEDSGVPGDEQPVPEKHDTKTAGKAKASGATGTSAAKPGAKPTTPIVVKNSSAAPVRPKATVEAAPAPSIAGIATPGAGGTLSNLIPSQGTGPKPVLQTVNISQGVSQGLLIKKVQPNYPAAALRTHVEGPVQLLATIAKSGNITAVKVISGEPLLAQAAVDAVKQWKYKPYNLNGEPVEIQTQITVNFKLPR